MSGGPNLSLHQSARLIVLGGASENDGGDVLTGKTHGYQRN